MDGAWDEVISAKEENRRELMIQGSLYNKKIEENGLDSSIFSLEQLNNLKIAGTPIDTLPDEIQNLEKLSTLSLENNKLITLPNTIAQLTSLRFLDVSGNKLSEIPPSFSNLVNLQSLNANLNCLTSFPSVSRFTQLAFISVSKNLLTALPEGICSPDLSLLSIIEADNNQIASIPGELSNLPKLAKLNIASNKLESLPFDLCDCPKLKEFIIAENKMKDRKFLKLADHSTKSLLAYLKDLQKKQGKGNSRNAEKKENHKAKQKKLKDTKKDQEELPQHVVSVLQFPDDKGGITVSVTEAALAVRPFLVCCILKNLDFSKSNNMFKRFITLQTKLHEGVCDRRNAATIATHDLSLVQLPLTYDAAIPSSIMIHPLFKSKKVSAEALMKDLREEADNVRKEKKKNILSGVHKYLDLLKDLDHYPYLKDKEEDVISLPPITNSDKTKISAATKDVLVEVTSSVSLELAKKAMEELILATLLTGAGTSGEASGSKEKSEVQNSEDTSRLELPQSLTVEQVKVLDAQGQLRVVYPSRVDLDNPAFQVVRNYE